MNGKGALCARETIPQWSGLAGGKALGPKNSREDWTN